MLAHRGELILAIGMLPFALATAASVATSKASAMSGCRSPDEQYQASPSSSPVSCSRCCAPVPEGCMYKARTKGITAKYTPWYNRNGIKWGESCEQAFAGEACPPCASCDTRTESEVLNLQRPAGCTCSSRDRDGLMLDPCFNQGSCECFCSELNRGLARCPHLEEKLSDLARTSPQGESSALVV
mmetsp:Transcript_46945/g.100446  ORF Transcript_46945/g.100446 Transcript_46945/m.100446 type:complete len:185 (+) Transcript_46945:76-630(+)